MAQTMINLIKEALATQRTISFIYDGKQKTVEVHAVGTSTKDASLVMRGYQVAGEASRPLPVWALYTLEKMSAATLSAFVDSLAPREGYKLGDKQMLTIIDQLKLAA
jgi:hypothetical protein